MAWKDVPGRWPSAIPARNPKPRRRRWRAHPLTGAQARYLEALIRQCGTAEERAIDVEKLTRGEASRLIDALLQRPRIDDKGYLRLGP